ncbi:DnaB-like helicase N-terminal domain-containing protein [Cerasicoccus frondis]|uniref:DnaB-like helicase N-terminal domain-containing protein n=1 Tax=Cerasicoccus frondis TaxID=490090 RepID=UPI0028527297|nr:DnaB-like helicase N-terminal domain-containing protein [Cerasicoccus frondis]
MSDFVDIDFPGIEEVSSEGATAQSVEATSCAAPKVAKDTKPVGRAFDDGEWERSATVASDEFGQRGETRRNIKSKGQKDALPYDERTVPHSLQTEQAVLACVLLLGTPESLALCQNEGVSDQSFYSPKHQFMWEALVRTMNQQGQCDEVLLRDELLRSGRYEEIGGDSYLFEVSDKVSSTAMLQNYCESIVELHSRRECIRMGKRLIAGAHDAQDRHAVQTLGQDFERNIVKLIQNVGGRVNKLRSLTEFAIPKMDSDQLLLGKNRYISRGDGVIVFGNAGVGKSSWQTLAAMYFACGMDFLGIPCPRPLKSLIVQKEDNDGDVAEAIESFFHLMLKEHGETVAKECVELVKQNVRIVRDREHVGDTLIAALSGYTAQFKPDLLWLNPLVSYAGCSVTDETSMAQFLASLDRVNRDSHWATIVLHHTPKPPADKEAKNRSWNEEMYAMSGSHLLPDWARAIISLKATGERGRFKLILAKRGTRCGIRRPKRIGADADGNPITELTEVVTEVPVRHGQGTFYSHTAERDVPLIAWEIERAWLAGEREAEDESANKGGRAAKHDPREVLRCIGLAYEENKGNGMSMNQYHKFVEEHMDIPRASFVRVWQALISAGDLTQDGLGKYFVPAGAG